MNSWLGSPRSFAQVVAVRLYVRHPFAAVAALYILTEHPSCIAAIGRNTDQSELNFSESLTNRTACAGVGEMIAPFAKTMSENS